ncbi:MAG: methyltransferase, partial [Patescibacteria group bacterium]
MDIGRETEWLLRDKYNGRMTAAAARDVARLKRGEHINYLIGWAPFLDCRIDLSGKPLIPRPETEHWTKKVLSDIKKSKSPEPKVLDLFCGSGCIGVAALKHAPEALVDFSDIEKKYFTGIRKSLRANDINPRRAGYVRSDVLKNIGAKKYDYILANPPYIPTAGRPVAKSVLS